MTTPSPAAASSSSPASQGADAPAFDQAALLARLRSGDPGAFEDLVRLTQDRLYAVALRMMGRPEDAMDAVQDAYLSAFKALPKFEGGSSLSTWLHRITVNACLMKLRTRRRKPEVSVEDLMPTFRDDGHQTIPARAWKPEASLGIEDAETRRIVRNTIDELPEPLREVVLLRDIEGMDTQTAADMLGITVSMVKTRLHRARAALKTLLEPHFTEKPR